VRACSQLVWYWHGPDWMELRRTKSRVVQRSMGVKLPHWGDLTADLSSHSQGSGSRQGLA